MVLKIFFLLYFMTTLFLITIYFLIGPRFNKNFQGNTYLQPMYINFTFYLVNSIMLFLVFNIAGFHCHLINLFLLGAGVVFSKRLRIMGLTGQISSGKSTTANYLREKYGASVVVIDEINKEVLSRPEVLSEIRKIFGDEVFLGETELDKLKLRQIVFSDEKKKKALESITHYRVLKTMLWILIREKFIYGRKYVILENAILFRFKALVYWCFPILSICLRNESELLLRIMKRDKCTQEVAENMIKSQFSSQDFYKLSDHCILNDGSENELYNEIDKFMALVEAK